MFKKILKLLGCIMVCQSAGLLGSNFVANGMATWYPALQKPFFNPPDWIFGITWAVIYTLMGIALFMIWQTKKETTAIAIYIFISQLVLNAAWSIIFFGLHQIAFACIELITLWAFILLMILKFYEIKKHTLWLLLPYIIWVSFAVYLNIMLWYLNPAY